MKKLFVLVLVLALLVVMITPALAAGPNGNGGSGGNGNGGGGNGGGSSGVSGSATGNGTGTGSGKGGKMPNVLIGTITSLDPVSRTVTVSVLSANIAAKETIGQTITFMTTESTSFVQRNPDGVGTPITFEALAVGQNVSVAGVLSEAGWTATRITVDPELLCLP